MSTFTISPVTNPDGSVSFKVAETGQTVTTITFQPTPPGIGAPVLTQTSVTGSVPFKWDTTVDSTVYAGMFWRLQVASDAAFTNVTEDISQIITASDLTGTVSFPDFRTWNGLGELRMRIEVDNGTKRPGDPAFDGTCSPWSAALSDTINLDQIGVKWDPAATSSAVTLSNGNRSAADTVAAYNLALGTTYHDGTVDGHVAFHIDANISGSMAVGFADSALSNTIEPWNVGTHGAAYGSWGTVCINGGTTTGLPNYLSGDLIEAVYRDSQIWFFKNGVSVNGGDPHLGTGGFFLDVMKPLRAAFWGKAVGEKVTSVAGNPPAPFHSWELI